MAQVGVMPKIEYRVEYVQKDFTREQFVARLNELGKEGWRLVAVNPLDRVTGGWVPPEPLPILMMREAGA